MDERFQNIACAILLAGWIASFFLPALSDGQNRLPGYEAAGLSFLALVIDIRSEFKPDNINRLEMLYLGSFWLANLFMIAAPFALRLARRARARTFVSLMGLWDILTCSYLFYGHVTKHMNLVRLGWWVWEGSLIAMTLLLYFVWYNAWSHHSEQPEQPIFVQTS